MNELQLLVKRLRKPSVIASLFSQIIALLMIFQVDVDMNMLTGAMTTITSILIILGIVSNPDAKTRGYNDDYAICSKCGKRTQHISINGQEICTKCGTVSDNTII